MISLKPYKNSEAGGVTIETSFILTIMILLTAGVFEGGLAYWQWNSAQQAARHGARLAAISDPVANDLQVMTGLGNGVEPGDVFPDYLRKCSGKSHSCDQGGFNMAALQGLIYGPDGDGRCETTTRERRGICDIFTDIEPKNIEIAYSASGLGRAGSPATLAPLITVTVKDLDFDFIILDAFLPGTFSKIPPVSVSVMSEDLQG